MAEQEAGQVGRPTALTDEVVRNLEEIFKIGGTVSEACSYAGIGNRTYYDHMRDDKEFRRKMRAAKKFSLIAAKNVILNAIIKDKDVNTSRWWVEKKEFNKQELKLKHSGSIDNPAIDKLTETIQGILNRANG